ncbi:neuronal acetylcholine receptor subunit beta-4-like [Saccostrea cucullata]|uniref:neuronal acetylcholine receptor subunit beta-4-like n=1 Tax=Saccostrea cuccullata TaxID=36930 RepID=UPI002ED65C26
MDIKTETLFFTFVLMQVSICLCRSSFEYNLFKDYSRIIKPRKNQSESVNVSFSMRLNTIHEVDEHQQFISFTAWFNVEWEDEFLTWNETDYSGINIITVSQKRVWVPDLHMYSSDKNFNTLGSPSIILVKSNGHMHWIPGGKFVVSCDLKMKKFPFDNQTCIFTLSAWLSPDSIQKLVPDQISDGAEKYITQNGEWEFTRFSYRVEYQIEYDVTEMHYELHLRRRYLYFVFSTLLPILALAVLNSLTFLIPLESGERIQYSLTLLLAFTVFLTLFEQTMPHSSTDVPYLSLYVGFQLFLCVVSTVISVISRIKKNKNDDENEIKCSSEHEYQTKDCHRKNTSEEISNGGGEKLNNNIKTDIKNKHDTSYGMFLFSGMLQLLSVSLLIVLFAV